MIVVVLIGIGAALAVPSFSGMIRDNQQTSEANNLLASMQLARSEAISREVQITLRRNGNDNQNWGNGWQVFTDWDGNGQFDGNADDSDCSVQQDCLLRTVPGVNPGQTLRSDANYHQWIAFFPTGRSMGSGGGDDGSFSLCDSTGNTASGRTIRISNTGRPSISEGVNACP
jgi:type IV fimbrial biogenesis protein FimT